MVKNKWNRSNNSIHLQNNSDGYDYVNEENNMRDANYMLWIKWFYPNSQIFHKYNLQFTPIKIIILLFYWKNWMCGISFLPPILQFHPDNSERSSGVCVPVQLTSYVHIYMTFACVCVHHSIVDYFFCNWI
jgi:hypothetical protein